MSSTYCARFWLVSGKQIEEVKCACRGLVHSPAQVAVQLTFSLHLCSLKSPYSNANSFKSEIELI